MPLRQRRLTRCTRAPARLRRSPLAAWSACRPRRSGSGRGARCAAGKAKQPPPPADDNAPLTLEELLATPPADPTAGPTWQEPHPLDARRWDLREAWRFPRKHRDFNPLPDPRSQKAFFDPEGRRAFQLPRTQKLDRAPAEFDHEVFLGPSKQPAKHALTPKPKQPLTRAAYISPRRPRRAAAARRGRQPGRDAAG
jgi:hypothetical protein